MPFATGWMGENHFALLPTQLYGVVLFMAGAAYWLLQRTIIAYQGADSILRKATGKDWKGKMSPAMYLVAIMLAPVSPWIAMALYVAVALMWIVPDPRIAKLYHK